MAIICAPVTEIRRGFSSEICGGDDTEELECPKSPPPPSSMAKWIQSTAVFRAWAEEWVLRPCEEAVFRLPISDHYLFVSVSPTLGIVRHSWFHTPGFVCDSVGNNNGMILRQSRFIRDESLNEYVIEEVGGDGEALKPVSSLFVTPCHPLYCNRKWIVGIHNGSLYVWQVAAGVALGGGSGVSVKFCDLQASVNEGKLVVTRKALCRARPCCIACITDGSVCTLHDDPSLNATGDVQFPVDATVIPIGTSHIFVKSKDAPKFEIFHNGGSLPSMASPTPAPTLSVPCTWAAPSISGVQSHLIVSTTQHSSETDSSVTEIKFAVHDCSTGFHVGDFTVPFTPSHFRF
ncbi:hypothetical protein Pelo_18380 [Pelomyxa schiedti]|nr:hypothetical protein Pelo_18380 [Pelomyxa schiedti]